MALKWKEYTLDAAAVDGISDELQSFLAKQDLETREIQRARLTAEELLLRILCVSETPLRLRAGIGKRFGSCVLVLLYSGDPFDPVDAGTEGDDYTRQILTNLGLSPVWRFQRGENRLTLTLSQKRRHSMLLELLIAVAAACVLGGAGTRLPGDMCALLSTTLIEPLMGWFLGLLSTFAGLMIFLTICSGVFGMGSMESLGKIGRSILLRFFFMQILASALCHVCALPLCRFGGAMEAEGAVQAGAIWQMLLDIFPKNPVEPLLSGNTLQISAMALFVGVGLLAMGDRTAVLRQGVEEGSALLQRITSGVCLLVPLFVFAALLRQIWSGKTGSLAQLWKPVVLVAAVEALFLLGVFAHTCARCAVRPGLLLRKIWPPFFMAFATASSVSAFGLSMDAGEKKLGIESATLRFGYPIGAVMYMPATCIYLSAMGACFAELYGVPVDAGWFLLSVLSATLLSIAMPPIPGGGLLVYSVYFSQLGIPAEAILLATLLDIVVEHLDTSGNIALLLLELVRAARAGGMLDREALLKE